MTASPTAAPRVERNAAWQRSASATTSSYGPARSASTATDAACAAGCPWPTPSTAAISASRPAATTSASSPDRCSPAIGRPAIDHSTTPARSRIAAASLPHALERVALAPLAHRDGRPAAQLRVDVELVHQPAAAGQPETEAAAARVALLQRPLHIRDPRPLIARHHHDRDALIVGGPPDLHLPGAGVDEDVAADLRD